MHVRLFPIVALRFVRNVRSMITGAPSVFTGTVVCVYCIAVDVNLTSAVAEAADHVADLQQQRLA